MNKKVNNRISMTKGEVAGNFYGQNLPQCYHGF